LAAAIRSSSPCADFAAALAWAAGLLAAGDAAAGLALLAPAVGLACWLPPPHAAKAAAPAVLRASAKNRRRFMFVIGRDCRRPAQRAAIVLPE